MYTVHVCILLKTSVIVNAFCSYVHVLYISYTKKVPTFFNLTEAFHAMFSVQSNLEFNVRMQEFVELVRRGEKMEAVR